MIEDTTFLIDVMYGDEAALTRLEELEFDNIPEKISSVSVLELWEGLYNVDDLEGERELITEVIESKMIVAADLEVMRSAGKLSGELRMNGKQIDREDCVIAATALHEDEPVLTRNTDHFQRIESLTVETY